MAPEGSALILPGVFEQPTPIGRLVDAVNSRFGAGTLTLGHLGAHTAAP